MKIAMQKVSGFREIYHNRHKLATDWKRDGKKVFGYLYSAVPEELIYAAGILPVQLTEGEASHTVARGRTILLDAVCDLMQSCLGQGLDGTYSYLDGLVIPDACASVKCFITAWNIHLDTPYIYYLTPPFEASVEGRLYYKKELNRFKKSIEEYCGREIGLESLRSAIEVYNQNRDLLKGLYELRLQDKPPICGSEVLEVVRAGLIMPKEEHNRMLRELLHGISAEEAEGKSQSRLLVSMLDFENCVSDELNILEMVEQMGGNIVFDDLCLGLRYFWEPVEPSGNLMEALLERYLGNIPLGFRYPLEPRMKKLLELAQKSNIDGAIFIVPKYCSPYLFEYPYIERSFGQRKIPTLLLESGSKMPAEQVRTRLQAFVEMLS